MKTVRLPIYEDGVETREVLEIPVYRLTSAFGMHAKVLPEPLADWERALLEGGEDEVRDLTGVVVTPEQEKETIDRIISGLPTKPRVRRKSQKVDMSPLIMPTGDERDVLAGFPPEPRDLTMEEAQERGYFATPPERPYSDWRKIPGYEGYTMNPLKIIIDEATDKPVGQVSQSRKMRVLLTKAETGRALWVDVEWLFDKTFPELNK